MSTKVVYNDTYGGFSLSEEAEAELIKRTGKSHWDIERHDPDLVAIVEMFGPRANGFCSKLAVDIIEEDRYYIEEYDGWEIVHTPETVEWVVVN